MTNELNCSNQGVGSNRRGTVNIVYIVANQSLNSYSRDLSHSVSSRDSNEIDSNRRILYLTKKKLVELSKWIELASHGLHDILLCGRSLL